MPKNLKELRQARADKAKRGVAATTEFNTLNAKDDRTTEEEAKIGALGGELDTLEAEVIQLDKDIVAEEASARRSGLFSSAAPAATLIPASSTARTEEADPALTGGFKSMADFAGAVVQTTLGHHDVRLGATTSTYNQNAGASGEGYLVPPEFSKQVWDIAFEDTDLLGMVAPEPTMSNAVFKPKDETTPWGAVGVQAVWRSEGAQMTATKVNVTGEMMTLHELYAFCAASSEVLADGPMLQDRLTRQAGNAIKWQASDAIMWGNGVGKPTGFMTAPCLITQTKESGQAAATVVLANLSKMASRVLRTGGSPIWIINADVMPQLVGLTLGNVPAYLPNNQPIVGSPWGGYLLGYPVLWTEHAQTLGTVGDIVCANMSGYYAATKGGGVDFATSIHLYFDQNLTAFRWTFRVAGQPYLSAAVSPAHGSTTKSHFVALQAR
ncbi:phage major capsid protein [Phenylobacterium sp.]|jgi:HK97 family phage major capsid protein|uniref:phage major capsid protein n=1 Tax=Phenylobacterium sp. TaxID=1871053 RepID=UPI002F407A37